MEFNHIFVKKELIDTNEDKILLTSSSTNVEYHTITDLELENIELPGNITVENLNGEDFESFKKSICFINVDTYIPGITYFDGVFGYIGIIKYVVRYYILFRIWW